LSVAWDRLPYLGVGSTAFKSRRYRFFRADTGSRVSQFSTDQRVEKIAARSRRQHSSTTVAMKKCKFCRNVFSSPYASQRVCAECRPIWWDKATRRERGNFASRQTVPLRFQRKTCRICRNVFVPEDKRAICRTCRPSWFEAGTNVERDAFSSERRLTPLRFQIRVCRECGSEFTPTHSAEVVCSQCRPKWWTDATENERSNWITKGNIPFRYQEKRHCLFCETLFSMRCYNEGFCGRACRKRHSRDYMKKWEAKLYESQPWRKMIARMRGRIHHALKTQSGSKPRAGAHSG